MSVLSDPIGEVKDGAVGPLRSLGYGKKSVENKILDEADHLVEAFKVSRSMADPGFPPSASPPLATLEFNNEQCRHIYIETSDADMRKQYWH